VVFATGTAAGEGGEGVVDGGDGGRVVGAIEGGGEVGQAGGPMYVVESIRTLGRETQVRPAAFWCRCTTWSEAGNFTSVSEAISLLFRMRACRESASFTPESEVSLLFSRFMNRGDPTLSKAPDGNDVKPAPDRSIPPPTAWLQIPSRTRGAPGKACDQMQHFSMLVGTQLLADGVQAEGGLGGLEAVANEGKHLSSTFASGSQRVQNLGAQI